MFLGKPLSTCHRTYLYNYLKMCLYYAISFFLSNLVFVQCKSYYVCNYISHKRCTYIYVIKNLLYLRQLAESYRGFSNLKERYLLYIKYSLNPTWNSPINCSIHCCNSINQILRLIDWIPASARMTKERNSKRQGEFGLGIPIPFHVALPINPNDIPSIFVDVIYLSIPHTILEQFFRDHHII